MDKEAKPELQVFCNMDEGVCGEKTLMVAKPPCCWRSGKADFSQAFNPDPTGFFSVVLIVLSALETKAQGRSRSMWHTWVI